MDFRLTTRQRFDHRIDKYQEAQRHVLGHHFWWFIHNCVAHPLIGVLPIRPCFYLHDFTADKINLKR